MYHERPRRRVRLRRWLAAAAAVLALLLGALALQRSIGRDMDAQAAAALRQSVVQAAVQCYAVEGFYPPSLRYLEENYGLQINRDAFIVSYSVFASNQMPDVTVLQKP